MKWTIGLITAPRTNDFNYLEETLNSFSKTGFELPVIFAEPNSIIPSFFKGDVIYRRKKFGDWTNWATGLYELLLSEPDSDYFLMLEDDVIFCSGIKDYLEHSIHKLEPFAYISLYTSSKYFIKDRPRMFHNECKGKNTWSTVAIIMSRSNVLELFSDLDVQKHRFFDIFHVQQGYWGEKSSYGKGRTSITDCVGNTIKDAVLGQWAEKMNLPVYFHSPSLAEHIGRISTLTDDDSTPENGRMSMDFVGENFDASQWVGKKLIRKKFIDIPSM
jgi:GR25 family glycosyltransferase involved in LPS biosynthesis